MSSLILFDATRPVKPTRRRKFAEGVIPFPGPSEPPAIAEPPAVPTFPRLSVESLDDRSYWAWFTLFGPGTIPESYAVEGEPRRLRFPARRPNNTTDRDNWRRGRV